MRTGGRCRAGGAGVVLGVVLLGAAAWACVPQPKLVTVLPGASGPPGSKVTVDGLGFDQDRIEVRWNGRDGEVLARAQGPDFSVSATIPQAPPGLYALIVLSRRANGSIGNTGRAAFQVTGEGGAGPTGTTATTTTTVAAGTTRDSQPGAGSGSSLDTPAAAALIAAGGAGGIGATVLVQRRRRRPGR